MIDVGSLPGDRNAATLGDTDATGWPADYVPGQGTKRVTLDLLGLRLDEVSWQDLEDQHPALAGALQEVVGSGYSPQQIRQYVMQREMPVVWARWLEQAARFLGAGDG